MPKLPSRQPPETPAGVQTLPASATVGPVGSSQRIAGRTPAGPDAQVTRNSAPSGRLASTGDLGIVGYNPAHKAVKGKKTKPCTDCGLEPKKLGHPLWCPDCWLRRQPISVQVAEARRRLARVPIEDHRPRVPVEQLPEGRRWCAGCQSARPVPDFADGATRCRPCLSDAAHRSAQNRTFEDGADGYDRLFELQGGRCAICRKRQISKRLAKDHDHETEKVRGLLCERCNHDLLGAAYDSLRILEAAVYYLRNPPTSGRWRPDVAEADPAPF